jgi:hypothetical protein
MSMPGNCGVHDSNEVDLEWQNFFIGPNKYFIFIIIVIFSRITDFWDIFGN